jgi:putative peptide zinc metalloprotease protein
MAPIIPDNDRERRKQVKLRLRPDLEILPQKYEGKTFYVVKDPVSLRYYRFKDQEHFLLQLMDGKHTLDDAQKLFEKRYRPDRLTLEDLEHFGQQLLTAGLAQNESPQAGKQLFDRRKKRKRREWIQYITNILYIKIPLFDPDKLLTKMLPWLRWIFTPWFVLASIVLMGSALMLVLTHFQTFRDKLPSYHEFFSFKTVIYLWISLAVVKVIHEFGHGLSCKAFGGEVHEMGLLFLCLSPCLFCNVSDAWTMPNKWKRMTISFAGIYVELIIAAIATFVWWYSPSHPFINNLALSTMVVCSISTVMFNANPLMRYDGYYVLLDWLEIPNLREKSNRYLKNVVLDKCLGVEVQPEPYMAPTRKTLFITYAIAAWIYRWVVTFAILKFMDSFLVPYKLGVISRFMMLFAAGSMFGWPLYHMGKNLYKRGRLPDMKRHKALATAAVVGAVVLFLLFVPLPISRVRTAAVVQVEPEHLVRMYVSHPAILEKLYVKDGQHVREGDELADLSSRELDEKLIQATTQFEIREGQLQNVRRQLSQAQGEDRARLSAEQARLAGERDSWRATKENLEAVQRSLKVRAPQPGVVMGCPRVQELGKLWEKGMETPLLAIGDPSQLRVAFAVPPPDYSLIQQDLSAMQRAQTWSEIGWLGIRVTDRGIFPINPDKPDSLGVTIRIQGRESHTWKGRLEPLPQSEAPEIPAGLTHKGGGVHAIKPGMKPGHYVPQAQLYLLTAQIVEPDSAIHPGTIGQVKVHCRWQSAAWWTYRTLAGIFDFHLM